MATGSWGKAMDGSLTSSASVYQGPRLGGHGDNIGTLEHVYWQTSELPQSLTTGNITHVLSQGKERG